MIYAILLGILLPVALYAMPAMASWLTSLFAPTRRTQY